MVVAPQGNSLSPLWKPAANFLDNNVQDEVARMLRTSRMQRSALRVTASLCAALAFAAPAAVAHAATYTAVASYVDPLGGRTSLLGINNAGWLTGSVNYADGTSQGVVRDADGAYTLFSLGAFTQGRAISEANQVSGYALDASLVLGPTSGTEFTRTVGGVVDILQNPGDSQNLHGIAQGMNSSGAIVGDYFTGVGNERHGYILDGSTFTDLAIPGSPLTSTRARAITGAGDVAGWTSSASGTQAFILSGGVYQFFSAPGGVGGTTFEDLNIHGVAVGNFTDVNGLSHAFTYDTHSNVFTNLEIAGATSVQAFGINDRGQVILTTNLERGPNNFIYDPNAVPEPATWAMMLLGFGAAGGAIRRRRRRWAPSGRA